MHFVLNEVLLLVIIIMIRRGMSPYHHHHHEGEMEEGKAAQELIMKIPLEFGDSSGGDSMPFSDLAEALRALSEARKQNEKREILSQLFDRCIRYTAASPPDRKTLELYLLLKMLMPSYDNECVYGMKTRRLMNVMGNVLRKLGRSEGSASLKQWLQNVPLQQSLLVKGMVVCLPELIMSSQCVRASPVVMMTEEEEHHHHDHEQQTRTTSLDHMGTIFRNLTTAYMRSQDTQQQLDTAQVSIMGELVESGGLRFQDWLTVIRILLKKVPMGVGTQTVLSVLPGGARDFFSKQNDLARLAQMVAAGGGLPCSVVCGIPFTPMTCQTMRSPYLMHWLFTKTGGDELGGKIVGLKKNYLVIMAKTGKWFVPMTPSISKVHRYVDLDTDPATTIQARIKHMGLLRDFKKSGLLPSSPATTKGKVIQYIIRQETEGGELVTLIIHDIQVINPEIHIPVLATDKWEVPPPDKKKNIPSKPPDVNNNSSSSSSWKEAFKGEDEMWVGKHRLRVVAGVATRISKVAHHGIPLLKSTAAPKQNNRNNIITHAHLLQQAAARRVLPKRAAKSKVGNMNEEVLAAAVGRYYYDKEDSDSDEQDQEQEQEQEQEEEEEEEDDEPEQDKLPTEEEKMLLVQEKMDGDRIQVHFELKPDGVDVMKVHLFTKWGKDVSNLYSNVCDELRKLTPALKKHTPCVLDGELIVLDKATELPMPWTSTKWRYNSSILGADDSKPLSELAREEGNDDDAPIAFVYNNDTEDGCGTINNMADEDESGGGHVAFGTQKGLKKWKGSSSNVKGRRIKGGMLRVIVYDIIMHKGRAVHEWGCKARFDLLQKELKDELKRSSQHCRVLENAYELNTMDKLIDVLRQTVETGQEGLVIKEPMARYHFGKSSLIQKLKMSGPEINTGIMGVGSSLSGNPRMCGLLTCVLWPSNGMCVSYCRVEFIQGETPGKAIEHVMTELDSRVSVAELEAAMRAAGGGGNYHHQHKKKTNNTSNNNKGGVRLTKYTVYMMKVDTTTTQGDYARKVVWRPLAPQDMKFECEILLVVNDLADIQWLVNPKECCFGLSVRGDLRPLKTETSDELLQPYSLFWKPRNPVGRVELRGFQMSKLDTADSIQSKFEEAQEVQTCVEQHALRRVAELRAIIPPKKEKLVEIARILQSFLENNNNTTTTTDKNNIIKKWPQVEYKNQIILPSIEGLDALLAQVKTWLVATKKYEYQRSTLRSLTPEERLALNGFQGEPSQWKICKEMQRKRAKPTSSSSSSLPNEIDATNAAENEALMEKMLARFKQLNSKLKPPVWRHDDVCVVSSEIRQEEDGEGEKGLSSPTKEEEMSLYESMLEENQMISEDEDDDHYYLEDEDEDVDDTRQRRLSAGGLSKKDIWYVAEEAYS